MVICFVFTCIDAHDELGFHVATKYQVLVESYVERYLMTGLSSIRCFLLYSTIPFARIIEAIPHLVI